NGRLVDTSTPGAKSFTVTATDKAGVQASKTVHYRVFAPPDTKITATKVNASKHSAKFSFKAIGTASGFRCALVKIPKPPKKPPRPSFKACSSPRTYMNLAAG